ncbi:hypothetical protein [Streptomyces sp. NPDC048425]|uniref:hypothetical protein n=1 Tax=Streptomyces sp. NPDC048425 TaxID=3365548 RepID=UPI0037126003
MADETRPDQSGGVRVHHRLVAVLDRASVRMEGEHGVEDLSGLLLEGHAGQEVLDALVDRAGRVLVGVAFVTGRGCGGGHG